MHVCMHLHVLALNSVIRKKIIFFSIAFTTKQTKNLGPLVPLLSAMVDHLFPCFNHMGTCTLF